MNIYSQDTLIVLIIISITYIITCISANNLKIGQLLNLGINLFVVISAFYKFDLEELNPSDSTFYYESGLLGVDFDFGTYFIAYCSGFLSNKLHFGFMPIFFIFSSFCIIAIHIFYKIFLTLGGNQLNYFIKYLILGIIVVPIGFWGAGLNKEGIALLGIALLFFSIKDYNVDKKQLIFSIILLMLSRPHIGIIAIISIFLGIISGKNARNVDRIIISTAALVSLSILIPFVLIYGGVEELSSSYIAEYTDVRSEIYADTNGYINIIDLSPPLRILSYLIRPFPWEARSVLQLLASFLNISLIISFILMIRRFYNSKLSFLLVSQVSYITFITGSLILLGMTTSNLGISNRQKWMVVVPIIMFIISRFEKNQTYPKNVDGAFR